MEESTQQGTPIGRVAFASFIGTTIEWYDFFIYGTAAALIFGQLFFPPNENPLIGTLAALATFAVGFIARPFGGLFFGHFGDRIGRKSMLVLTLMIMGIATFIVGLLPTYNTIGLWAPALLVVMRILQGFAVGGEWGGAVLMAVEHAPSGKKGFYGSWPQTGVPVGLVLATAAFAAVTTLPEEAFLAWGWRIPFLVSIILVGVGVFVRLKIAESPAFTQVQETQQISRLPIVDAIRTHPKSFLVAMGARAAETGLFYIFAIFVLTYGTQQLQLPRSLVLTGVLIAACAELVTVPFFGWLSDKVGRRPIYMGAAAFSILFAFPFFWLLNTEVTVLIWLAIVIGFAVCHAGMYGPQAAFFAELFGSRVRYSGASVGYQVTAALVGGVTPLLATGMLIWTGGDPWPVALYMAGLSLLTLGAVYWATETFRDETDDTSPQEARDSSGAMTRRHS